MEEIVSINDESVSVNCIFDADRAYEYIEKIIDIIEQLGLSDYYITREYTGANTRTKTLCTYTIYFGDSEQAMAFKLIWS